VRTRKQGIQGRIGYITAATVQGVSRRQRGYMVAISGKVQRKSKFEVNVIGARKKHEKRDEVYT